jgi:hypothetical protein
VQVETVAWITELKNLESLFFYLLALLAWMNFVDEPDRSWWHCYGLALAAYLLSLFAKTTACTLPAAMLLVLWLQGQRLTWSRCIQILPFLLAGLGMGLVSVWWEKHLGNYDDRFGLPLSVLERMLIAGRALWFYAGKLAWPVDLTFSYPHWDINPGALLQYVPLAGCIAVAAILWIWQKKSGAVRWPELCSSWRPFHHCLGLSMNTPFSTLMWRIIINTLPPLACWRSLPPSCGGGFQLTLTNYDAAADCYRQALQLDPINAGLHYNLGLVQGLRGQMDAERQELTEALRLKPGFSPAQQQLQLLNSK